MSGRGEGPSLDQIAAWLARSDLARRLESARRYLLWGLVVFAVGSMAAFAVAPRVLADMQTKQPAFAELVMLAPAEGLLVRMKIALALGAATAIPAGMLGIWAAATQGWPLGRKLGRLAFIPVSLGLFAGGSLFAYQWVIPPALRFLLAFARDELLPLISINSFVNFVLSIVVPFGIVFQLPLLVLFAARLGMLDHRTLAERRRYAIVGIAAAAAALTPGPDVFSQLLMALPLVALYELSIWIAWLARPRSNRRASSQAHG